VGLEKLAPFARSGPPIWVNFQSMSIDEERSARNAMPLAVGLLAWKIVPRRTNGSYQLLESDHAKRPSNSKLRTLYSKRGTSVVVSPIFDTATGLLTTLPAVVVVKLVSGSAPVALRPPVLNTTRRCGVQRSA
jgi:hypothetical protein